MVADLRIAGLEPAWRMIPKSGYRFSDKIMRKQNL